MSELEPDDEAAEDFIRSAEHDCEKAVQVEIVKRNEIDINEKQSN